MTGFVKIPSFLSIFHSINVNSSFPIITGIMGKSAVNKLSLLKQPSNSLVSVNDKTGEEVGLESTLYKAFKAIIITDIFGFILAAAAALLSAI